MPRSYIFFLTAVAGYVDAATYTHMSGLFSAHVTGNIVVFAAALAQGLSGEDYLKLLSFPLFLLSIGSAVSVYFYGARRHPPSSGIVILLLLQGAILLVASLAAGYFAYISHQNYDAVIAMSFVFAMGFQNALHRFVPGPMSTVMTGNVMNWAASMTERLFHLTVSDNPSVTKAKVDEAKNKPPVGRMILGFTTGCLVSALVTHVIGLSSCIIPACVILAMGFLCQRQARDEKGETV